MDAISSSFSPNVHQQKGSFVLDMRTAYRYDLTKSTNEKQLLFVMVLALEEVSWPTVSSAFGKDDYHHEKNPFEEVRDRSLSYLDINFREQASNGRSKVFESVRKFGRPRQQFSDILDFSDPSLTSAERGERNSFCGDRYHFGQCLVLPKLCTLPPKGKHCRHKTSYFPAKSFPERERYEFKNHERALLTLPIKLISSREGFSSSDTSMFRWTEVTSENYSKNASFSHGENGSLNPKSRGKLEGRKDLGKFYDEDVEAQVDTRESRNFDGDDEFKGDFYRQSTLDGRRMIRGSDDIKNLEMRIYNIRENCRMKLRKEKEEKQCAEQSTMGGRTSKVVSDAEDEVWVQPQMRKIFGEKKQDLPRSKSTPDMLEGTVGRKLEVWPQREEPKRNGSMINVGDKNWQVYNDEQEADSLNEPNSFPEPVSLPELSGGAKSPNSRFASGKNFFGQFLNSRGSTPTEMSSNTEPFSQFWVSLSNIYGQALVVIMLALSLTEVMDNSVKLLSLQGAFLIYLYVGSIAVIICIYIWVLIDSCSSIQKSDSSGPITTNIIQGRDKELQNLSTTKFGSLKKAHISRDRTSNTSFYLRIGAIAFGLGTLVFNGLEMAMHSMMESSCLNEIIFVHPILHGLFTFLQMHFLFVNSQVLVERFGLTARFGFMHLAATNLALWIRLVIWESGNEWTYYVHLSQQDGVDYHSSDIPTPLQLRGFPKFLAGKEKNTMALGISDNNVYQAVSKDHISQVVSLHECLNTNSLGRLWTSSMPFLYPFIIQFSLIAAAVTYIMGQNVAKNRLFFQKQKKMGESNKNLPLPTAESDVNAWNVDCGGASKGLFLGILCLVAGVVVIIIFLVVKENEDFPSETIFWLTMGMLLAILSVTVLMNVVGLIQVRKLSVTGTKLTALDKILSVVSVLGVQLYTILGIVVGASGIAEDATEGNASPEEKRHGMLLAVSVIQLLQSIMQSTFIVEGIRRTSLTRAQAVARPARQVVTFLIFSNAVLWVFDAFVIQSWISQELQLRFFGVLAWGALSRISLPLLVFFRFHSCVLLLEIWKKSYNSLHLDPGN